MLHVILLSTPAYEISSKCCHWNLNLDLGFGNIEGILLARASLLSAATFLLIVYLKELWTTSLLE